MAEVIAPRGTTRHKRKGRLASLRFFLTVIGIVELGSVGAAQTLDRIATTNAIRIGFIADQAPFSLKGSDNSPAGYSIELCKLVVAAVRKQVPAVTTQYVETDMSDAFDAVAGGQIDLLCGAITATLSRREKVDFSEPIFVSGATAAIRKNAPTFLHDLLFATRTISRPRSPELTPFATARVGVRGGTTTDTELRRAIAREGYKATVVNFTSHAEGIAAVEDGAVDAYFADRALLAYAISTGREFSGLILGTRIFSREPYAIAMRRGDSNLRLLVDRTLSGFYATPQIVALLSRFFGAEAETLVTQIRALTLPE